MKTVQYRCDQCNDKIPDHQGPIKITVATEIEPTKFDGEYEFCSYDCFRTWVHTRGQPAKVTEAAAEFYDAQRMRASELTKADKEKVEEAWLRMRDD